LLGYFCLSLISKLVTGVISTDFKQNNWDVDWLLALMILENNRPSDEVQ
jgi:hypothetical protein